MNKIELPEKCVRRLLKALYIDYEPDLLTNGKGKIFRLYSGRCAGAAITAFKTGTVTVQGKGVSGQEEVKLVKGLLRRASKMIAPC